MVLSHTLLELEVKIELLKQRFPERSVAQTEEDIQSIQKELEDITLKVLQANVPLELTLAKPILN